MPIYQGKAIPGRRRRKLTRERDAARFDSAKEAMENERLRAEIEMTTTRVGSLTAEVEAQRQQISALVAEVERLKRERAAREADSLAALTEWAEKYRDARRAAMEDAAGIADRTAGGLGPHGRCGARCAAAAIRAAVKETK